MQQKAKKRTIELWSSSLEAYLCKRESDSDVEEFQLCCDDPDSFNDDYEVCLDAWNGLKRAGTLTGIAAVVGSKLKCDFVILGL